MGSRMLWEKTQGSVFVSSSDANKNKQDGKVIVDDVLCFLYNHMLNLSSPAIRRLCLETYSSSDITQAYNIIVNVLTSMNKSVAAPENVSAFTKDEKTLEDILFLLKKEMLCLPQIVSTGRHIPRYKSYQDVLCMSSLLDEMQELKQLVKDMHSKLYVELFTVRTELLSIKIKLQAEGALPQDLNIQAETRGSDQCPGMTTRFDVPYQLFCSCCWSIVFLDVLFSCTNEKMIKNFYFWRNFILTQSIGTKVQSRTWVPNMQPTHGLHVAHDVFWEIIDELL